jgi:hypothetical protein
VVGKYNVWLQVTSLAGCVSSVTRPFVLNGALPQSIFTIDGGNEQCSNNAISIINNSIVDFGSLVKMEIYWDYTNNPTNKTIISHPLSGAVYNHTYPEFFTPTTKEYTIQVVAYSGDNCLSTSSQKLILKATPQLVFDSIPAVCANAPAFQLTQAKLMNGLSGSGIYSGKGVASALFDPKAAGAGNDIIRYTYTGNNGCINFTEQTITVFPVPAVDAGPDKFILEGGSGVLSASA